MWKYILPTAKLRFRSPSNGRLSGDCIDNSSFLRPDSRLDVVVFSEPYLRRKLVLTRCDILVYR